MDLKSGCSVSSPGGDALATKDSLNTGNFQSDIFVSDGVCETLIGAGVGIHSMEVPFCG